MPGSSSSLGFTAAVVQSGFALADYASAEAFGAKVRDLTERAMSRSPRPALIAFPELTGMWLPLLAGAAPRSIGEVVRTTLARHPLQAARSLLSGRGLSFAFAVEWRRHFAAWLEPFREAAVGHDVYVCPGSTFLPGIDRNATRDWELFDRRLYNTACLLSPRGRILALTRKVHLTADEARLGVCPGDAAEVSPCETELGPIGILVCLDGFYESLVGRLDGAGARLVIQPSANPVPWKAVLHRGRWVTGPQAEAARARRGATPDPSEGLTQEEQWLSLGIGSLIQGRESIRFALNPMSVSRVLRHDDEGQSSVFANLPDAHGAAAGPYPGLLSVAPSWDREGILFAEL